MIRGFDDLNNLVFNNTAKKLFAAIFGVYDDNFLPVALDANGLFLFSPQSVITVTATNLDIRALRYTIDSVTVTATDLDIRPLTATQDSVAITAKGFAEQTVTQTVSSGTTFLLPRDISSYSQNSFFVHNNSGGTITVAVQIAPANDNTLFVNNTTPTGVSSGNNLIMVVGAPMKFARISVTASGNVGVTAYYNGRV